MDVGEIKAKVRAGAFVISDHASTEAADEEIHFDAIRQHRDQPQQTIQVPIIMYT